MGRTTIKDLARELGLSICTINKALTGKKRISEETRQRVLEAAQRMDYRPNRLAQALVRRPVSIGIIYPENWPGFFEPLIEGVRHGLKNLQDHNVRVKFFRVAGLSASAHLSGILGSFGGESPDGLIICPASADRPYSKNWNILVERNTPFIFLGSEVLGAPRLACFRMDGLRCGRMAAELLGQLTGGEPAAILIGRRDFPDHRNKIEGFTEEARRFSFKVLGDIETFDDPKVAYRVTRRLFSDHPEIRGLYVATDNSEGVCRYLIRQGAAEKVKLIVTGVSPEVRKMMDLGVARFTIYQNMEWQGRIAVRSLYRYLAERTAPPDEILVPPVIIMRNNFDLIRNYLAGYPEGIF